MKNNYKKISNLFLYFSFIILIIMTTHLSFNYKTYTQYPEYSAPFYLYSLGLSSKYILATIICIFVSIILNNRA